MPVERSLVAQIGRNLLDSFVPGHKKRRVESEAKKNLDSAWSNLGDEKGKNVTEEQIRTVLEAELKVLQTLSLPYSRPFYHDEGYLRETLELHTQLGLNKAKLFMHSKVDKWGKNTYDLKVEEPDSEMGNEAQRRLIACGTASELLSSMSLAILLSR